MSRLTYIKIAGKNYPMSFSLGASKKLIEKFGGVEKIQSELSKPGKDLEKLDLIMYVLSLLISQGCAYKNYFEKDMPVPEDSPVIDGKWVPIPQEVLEIAVQMQDMEELTEKISACIARSNKKEVEAKPAGKNAKATQG